MVIWKICGIMARLALANLYVLVLVSHNCFLRHSIIGGMDTRAKKRCSSRNGSLDLANSLGTTSKFGRTDTHSSQRSRDPLYHLNAHEELSSHLITPYKNVSELTPRCWQQCKDGSLKLISTQIHSDTNSQYSQSTDDWNAWYWENGGET